MEVITEGTNSPKLTLSASPPLQPPTNHLFFLSLFFFFLVFASGCLSQLSFSPLPANITPDHAAPPPSLSLLSETHYTFKKFFLFPVSACHMCTPKSAFLLSLSLSLRLSVFLSVHSDTSLSDCVRLVRGWGWRRRTGGGESGGFQTLSPTSAP